MSLVQGTTDLMLVACKSFLQATLIQKFYFGFTRSNVTKIH